MKSAVSRVRLPAMDLPGDSGSVVFEVEIERGAEPIHGYVRAAGLEMGFDGWVGLAAAIESIVDRPGNGNEKGRA